MSRDPLPVVIRDLEAGDATELGRAIAAMRATDPDFPFALGWDRDDDFTTYRARLAEQREGRGLPPGWVPGTLRFAFVGTRLAGRVSVRHRLTPTLERAGGHIGYGVIAEFRGRGVATALLRDGLVVARGLGIADALVTCDPCNAASLAVIERCGGVPQTDGDDAGRPVRRYLVPT